jgi:hypothetical protein
MCKIYLVMSFFHVLYKKWNGKQMLPLIES